MTIYGASPDTYEKVTGSAEAFERAIEGMRKLRTLPSKMEYRMTVIKDNFDDVDAAEMILRDEVDPNAEIVISRYVCKAARGACADVGSVRTEPGQLFALSIRRTIDEIRKEVGESFGNGRIEIEVGNNCEYEPQIRAERAENQKHVTLFGCEAGMNCYTVSWDGKILPCQMMSDHWVEVDGSFSRAWERLPERAYFKLPVKCRSCEYAGLCHICTATCFNEAGGYKDPPAYLCEDAKICSQIVSGVCSVEKGKDVEV